MGGGRVRGGEKGRERWGGAGRGGQWILAASGTDVFPAVKVRREEEREGVMEKERE